VTTTATASSSIKISDSIKLQWIRDFRKTHEMWEVLTPEEKRMALDGMVGNLVDWKANPEEARDEIVHALREANPDKFSIGAFLGFESYGTFPEKMDREELAALSPEERIARKRQRQKERRDLRKLKKAPAKK
jgi:hypothetical protein